MNERPSDASDEQPSPDNIYAPMSSQQSDGAAAGSNSQLQFAPFMIKLISLLAVGSVVFTVYTGQAKILQAVADIIPGVVVGFVVALAPVTTRFGWVTKYLYALRGFFTLVAVALLIPVPIPRPLFETAFAFFACLLALICVLEWVYRRLRAG